MRVVVLARKHVQVYRSSLVCEVRRDEGCFDELRHRKTCHSFVFAKVDHDALTETFHLDEVAQFDYELLNLIRVADNCRIASVDVNSGM
ncbi:MAG: hypothetical protein UY39_C0054G0009 [Candidatus Kaiserbacteria bacterium GW2011_GWC2_49_12]|uniref:Uncharacterized protein n=1 Tax=Candidatus Kaiserbacteria bacterium GW2011_GWC2_49_12 TaxID=1618675 RepID=A0A0G1YH00_9BACT|nr:MAG: hypothetical protein UY39_C0054G0009 [Candidatus Kaiserbacteria bacterium GW2011_GWC2_49_12]